MNGKTLAFARRAGPVLAAALLVLGVSGAAWAEPPPWAPAHGYRAKFGHGHQPHVVHEHHHYYHGYPRERAAVARPRHHRGHYAPAPRHYAPAPRHDGGTFGALVGAALGGLLGAQIGDGKGQLAATAAGSVGGYVVGREIGRYTEGARHGYAR